VPKNLPFELTNAQNRSIDEILADCSHNTPMNRLLIGDVGSGKTVVAGCVGAAFLANGWSAAIIAPTKILANQHAQSMRKMFPDMPIELISGNKKLSDIHDKPQFYIGTHKLINRLEQLKPGLIVYDEQHRFGVDHRSASINLAYTPHILTMTATPIPRSLMLTIFAHLQVSHLDELPPGRKTVKTWYTPRSKRVAGYQWVAQQLQENGGQAIVVCPFIDPSDHDAFDKVAATSQIFDELTILNQEEKLNLRIGLLHGRQKPKQQSEIIEQLYDKKIDLLVTTPIVEVGVDLPSASIIVIESAERFGLASLHQLRGRVGRAGQQGYCVLFSSNDNPTIKSRLEQFGQINNGKELAELDLERRGSGDLFGTSQSGFDQLRFGSWADSELIGLAQRIFKQLPVNWQSILPQSRADDSEVLGN
jgi:ATP-dependent DNA helicase RecG